MPTNIEWTEETWNPLIGCSRVGSPGCENCYAIGVVHRGMAAQHRGLTVRVEGRTDWTGEVREVRHLLDRPLRWTRPRKVFVNSLSDLFHPAVPTRFIAEVFAVMGLASQHTFQVLTKRPQRMAAVLSDPGFVTEVVYAAGRLAQRVDLGGLGQPFQGVFMEHFDRLAPERFPLANVWLGTSIESDRYAFRADHLRATPAALRWVSAEPLLGPLDGLVLDGVDWVVAGGESGPSARPMHPGWLTALRDRCADADVAFLVKQWGEWAPNPPEGVAVTHVALDGSRSQVPSPGSVPMFRAGKRAAGRIVDRVLYDAYPDTVSSDADVAEGHSVALTEEVR